MTSPVRRNTRQKTLVIDALKQSAGFVSAQQLHHSIIADGGDIGLSTVYRTLAASAEAGDVDVIVRADGESVYRACSPRHHHHLVCTGCGATQEISAQAVEKWSAEIGKQHNYTQISHTVEVFGLCSDCAS